MSNIKTLAEPHTASEEPTCGKGLAEQSALPAKLGELIASLAENLEVHLTALDLTDENARKERTAYVSLAKKHRDIAAQLTVVAGEMAGYRDLPMGRHDEQAMLDPKVFEIFETFTKLEQELLALLQEQVEQNQTMLAEMRNAG
jgi:hypothetical protein